MIPNFNEILSELSYRVDGGMPDLNKESHVTHLINILRENGVADAAHLAQRARVYFSYLNEAPATKPTTLVVNKDSGAVYPVQNFDSAKHTKATTKDIQKAKANGKFGTKEPKPAAVKGTSVFAGKGGKVFGNDKPKPTTKSKPNVQYVSKTGTKEMESRDGSSFEGYKTGNLKAPGTPAGAFAEVGGLKIAGYLREHPNASDEELTNYISNWAKNGKATKPPSVSGGDKLTAAVHTGRAIFEEISEVASEERYNPATTTAEGYWGDKQSLMHAQQRVDEIAKKNPKATFNGKSAQEYKKIIEVNGAGENPTDSMVIIWDGKSNNVSLLHVSNKIGSNNIQANSTVKQTYDRAQTMIDKSNSLKPVEKDAATKVIAKRKLEGVKLQKKQIDYQLSFLPKYAKLATNPKGLKTLTADIYGENVRRGDAIDGMYTGKGAIVAGCSKLSKINKTHPACKLINNPKAKPEAKVAGMLAFFTKYPDSKIPGTVREIISRTATMKDAAGKPKYKTGYDSSVINSLYGQMNDQVEGMRGDLNKIQKGLGDRMMTHDFASRLHLTIAEGHNPGGIPANRFKLVMGNNEADIWYKDEQAYQKLKTGFHKVNDDGSLDKNPTKMNPRELNRGNIATIGDVGNFQHCLGVPKGKTIDEYMNVKYQKINTETGIQSAHIFDINGRDIGIMTIRTKSGPGGDANDTLQFSKDMQNCMQKQEYLKKRNKK